MDEADEETMGGNRTRRVQTINRANMMPPIPGFNQTLFGWNIEPNQDDKEGYCITAPNQIAGPFPHANLTTCINHLQFACYNIEQHQCPCYDKDEIEGIKTRLMRRIFDPDFQIDMNLSCKNPQQNNGLPFGLYTQPNGLTNKMYGSTLRLGTDIKLASDTMFPNFKNMCYEMDSHEAVRLTKPQHKICISLMETLCDFVEQIFAPNTPPSAPTAEAPVTSPTKSTPPKVSSCSDDVDFRYKGKSWASCPNLNTRMSRRKRKRVCRKYDDDTQKYVFQHCRKSCQMCTCRDDANFIFNNNPEYNCDWVSTLEGREKKSICANSDVNENCKVSCGSRCCRNSPTFKYWKELEYDHNDGYDGYGKRRNLNRWEKWTCKNVTNANWKEECKNKKVAINCPMICRKCFIQPRL